MDGEGREKAASSMVGPLCSLILRKLSSSCLMVHKDRQASSTAGDLLRTWQRDRNSSSSLPFSSALYEPRIYLFLLFFFFFLFKFTMSFGLNTNIAFAMLTSWDTAGQRLRQICWISGLIQSVSISLYSCLVAYEREGRLLHCWQFTACLAAWPQRIIPPSLGFCSSSPSYSFPCFLLACLCVFHACRAPLMLQACVLPDILKCGQMWF